MTAASPYLRPESPSRHLWVPVAVGLVGFAVACGFALALGELDALYVTLSLITCIAVFYDFRIGAVLLVLMLPIAGSTLFPRTLMGLTGLNPLNLLLAGTLASYVLRGRLQRAGSFLPKPLLWLYVVPIVVGGLLGARHVDDIAFTFFESETLTFTGAIGYLRDMLFKPLLIPAAALLVGAAVARSQKPERFLVPIALSVWIIAAVQIGFVIAAGTHPAMLAATSARDFFDAMGLHANDLGRLYAIAYGLLLFAWWESSRPGLKLLLFATMGVLTLALVLTFSRAAFLGFLLISALFVMWKFNVRTLALALLGVATAAVLAPGYLYRRITVGFDSGNLDEVSAGRIEGIWEPLAPEVWNSPLWGEGLGSTMWSYPMQVGAMLPVTHPHNAYLEGLLDMGLIGLVLLLAYYLHVWKGLRSLASNAYLSPEMRGLFQGACAGLLCFAVTGMAGSSLRPETEAVYLWMAIGMMYGMLARRPEA
ncbi:MAG TPA: O-antigen ligase family protein [Burkholderiales bacterium]|nr:O-antigen ligase family protein [Burkholderiales bacterium]